VLWTFTPVTYGLELSADVVLYHCVDLLHTVKGVDATAVLRGERSIAPRTATAIGTSAAVAAHLREAGFRRVLELPNVADVGVFTRRAQPASRRRRAVLFAGNLTAAKLDVPLLESVATALRGEAELVLAGPVAADFTGHLERLVALGATHVGSLSLDDLATLSGECTVGLIPYSLNDYTAGVSPLKCFEYLAAGLAIASTALPEVVRLAATNQHVRVAEPGAIPALLRELLQQPATADADAAIAARIESAEGNGWQTRGELLRDLLRRELAAT
jgi:hypothetical protein